MFRLKKKLIALCLVLTVASVGFVALPAVAQSIPPGCPGGPAGPASPGTKCPDGSTPTAANNEITKNEEEFECPPGQKLDECVNQNPIVKTLRDVVNFLSAGVGIIVIAMIIVEGIQYTTSQGDPEKTAKARRRISNALIALLAYIFLFSFLQWVVPGGLF